MLSFSQSSFSKIWSCITSEAPSAILAAAFARWVGVQMLGGASTRYLQHHYCTTHYCFLLFTTKGLLLITFIIFTIMALTRTDGRTNTEEQTDNHHASYPASLRCCPESGLTAPDTTQLGQTGDTAQISTQSLTESYAYANARRVSRQTATTLSKN